MKYEVCLKIIDESYASIEEFEVSKFHFNEIKDFLNLLDEHKKLLKDK
jgi:hypothetical protein